MRPGLEKTSLVVMNFIKLFEEQIPREKKDFRNCIFEILQRGFTPFINSDLRFSVFHS